MKHKIVTMAVLWLVAVSTLWAQITLNPTADTDTQSDVAAGTSASLNISQWCNPLVRFDLSSIAGTVSTAKLRLYFPTGNTAFTLNAQITSTDTWSEGGTKPNAGGSVLSKSISAASGAVYVEVDLTAYVQSKISGNKIASLVLSNNLDTWTTFNSRQSSTNKPELVVTTSGITPPPLTGHVEAENWTAMLGVQTETTTDAGGGLNVGWINSGDWMDYSLNFATAGTYNVSMRIAGNGGSCQIKDGAAILSTVAIPTTGGWQIWRTITTTINVAQAGQRTIRFLSTSTSGWNINYFDYSPSGITPTTFTLSTASTNGTVSKSPNKTSYNAGEVVTLTATPNSGFTFSNWTGDITGTTNPVNVTMNSNKNITANFSPVTTTTFTLSTTATNGTVTKSPNKTAYNSGEVVTLTATPNSGFVFSSWSGAATGTTNPVTVTMNANKSVTANFTAIATTFTLTTSATNGTVTKNPNKATYNSGESVTLTATPASGFAFNNWSGDATGFVNPIVITMNGNKNITANFSISNTGPTTLMDQNATQETKNLWNYLNQIYGQHVLTGIWEKSGLDDVRANSGKVAAILGQDMNGWSPRSSSDWEAAMTEQSTNLINHYNNGGIVTVNWHWDNPFDFSKDAWSSITATQWNNLLIPGTSENTRLIADIDLHVNRFLKRLVDRNGKPIPILFRLFHEIDGGWFWWTNQSDPSKTARLYKLVQDRIINFHQLHNLIWIWNNSEDSRSVAHSGPFYPGNSFIDFVGVDLYNIDFKNTGIRDVGDGALTFKDYYNMLGQIAPGKMRALCEIAALPNADKTANNDPAFPRWLYALAWYSPNDGTFDPCLSSPCNPPAWVNTTFNHSIYLTLDEIATNGSRAATTSTGGRMVTTDAVSSEQEIIAETSGSSAKVFPNPTDRGNFNIILNGFKPNETVSVDIVPINGASVYYQVLIMDGQGGRDIKVREAEKFKSGVYILKVRGQSKRIVNKFMML